MNINEYDAVAVGVLRLRGIPDNVIITLLDRIASQVRQQYAGNNSVQVSVTPKTEPIPNYILDVARHQFQHKFAKPEYVDFRKNGYVFNGNIYNRTQCDDFIEYAYKWEGFKTAWLITLDLQNNIL